MNDELEIRLWSNLIKNSLHVDVPRGSVEKVSE
jgi:hypothetical protein